LSGKKKFTIGIEFGNETVTALLVNVSNGNCINAATYHYTHGIITEKLPETDVKLGPGWALHHPRDYITALKRTVPQLLKGNSVDADQIIGIGISFADSTLIPTTSDGTPLALLEDYKDNPNAWPKAGRHTAAKDKANQITQLAAERFETFLDRYGGQINAEWFFPKVWETYEESSSIYHAADRLIEGCDWVTWQLTGVESRSIAAAGYKALWSKTEGFPLETFFGSMAPDLANVIDDKMLREITPLGQQVGELTEEAARWMKLPPGIPVTTGTLNNQAAVPATGVVEPGNMAILLGTRFVHLILSDKEHRIPGMVGMVQDGIIPGHIGYEAGQASGGDHFAWFIQNAVPEQYAREARRKNQSIFEWMERKAAALEPAESGLIALDWWNGNRSILVDEDLSGLILGYNLQTKPEEIYRAMLEATAYGTRKIIETFIASGVPINEIILTGGAPMQNQLLLNILANVTGMEIKVANCPHSSAMGAAMYAAVAAGEDQGGYASIEEASQNMAHLMSKTFLPNNNDKKVYNRLYSEYTLLHDYFGYGYNDAMKRLKNLRAGILEKKQR